jgi:Domain of unknown function (DUF4272)
MGQMWSPRVFVALAALIVVAGEPEAAPTLDERKVKILAADQKVPAEALRRKERSEIALMAEGVPVNKFLPVVETEKDAKRRTTDEVAYRALALLVVAVKGEGLDQPTVEKLVKDYGLESHLTPKERAFVRAKAPSQHERVQFAWRYEAAWTLLWALGYVDKLEKPVAICDVPKAVKFMQQRKTQTFIAEAKLRPMTEILDQVDRIYRYHWAVVDARVNGRQAPAKLEPGVTLERHYALNWLVGYMDQAWDDVSTDT